MDHGRTIAIAHFRGKIKLQQHLDDILNFVQHQRINKIRITQMSSFDL